MSDYRISEVALRAGWLGIAPLPGRTGFYEKDLSTLLNWKPTLVFTMTQSGELDYADAGGLGTDLAAADVLWRHLPIADMGPPPPETEALWSEASVTAHSILDEGGRVFAHCFGGCGRAGMALLRLMVEAGEDVDPALERLRTARPCAVETNAQLKWASIPMYERLGWTP